MVRLPLGCFAEKRRGRTHLLPVPGRERRRAPPGVPLSAHPRPDCSRLSLDLPTLAPRPRLAWEASGVSRSPLPRTAGHLRGRGSRGEGHRGAGRPPNREPGLWGLRAEAGALGTDPQTHRLVWKDQRRGGGGCGQNPIPRRAPAHRIGNCHRFCGSSLRAPGPGANSPPCLPPIPAPPASFPT